MFFRSLVLTALAAVLVAPAGFAADAPLKKGDVDGIIKEWVQKNPDLILDSLRKGQEKQMAEQQKKAAEGVKTKQKEIFNDPDSPVGGNPKGDVVIAEFFDYHCGYCKKMLPVVTQLIEKDSKIKVVFHELPILSKDSETAARAALAVAKLKPEKYFAFHTALMNVQGAFDETKLTEEAKKIGIDGDKLKKEMESDRVSNELKKTSQLAQDLGIRGTPAFVIGDQLVPGAGSYEDLKKMVDEARKAKK